MSFWKRILKELYKFYEQKGPNNYVLADTLSCFTVGNEKFPSALKQLLKERLVLGIEEPKERRVAVALNPDKIKEIEESMHNWYEDQKFWITTLIAIGAFIVDVWQIFLK